MPAGHHKADPRLEPGRHRMPLSTRSARERARQIRQWLGGNPRPAALRVCATSWTIQRRLAVGIAGCIAQSALATPSGIVNGERARLPTRWQPKAQDRFGGDRGGRAPCRSRCRQHGRRRFGSRAFRLNTPGGGGRLDPPPRVSSMRAFTGHISSRPANGRTRPSSLAAYWLNSRIRRDRPGSAGQQHGCCRRHSLRHHGDAVFGDDDGVREREQAEIRVFAGHIPRSSRRAG